MVKKEVKSSTKLRDRVISISFVILALIIFDLTPFGGTIAFYSKWISCGQKPVYTLGSGYLNAGVSHYVTPPDINILQGSRSYFCTAFDAEKRGYSASPASYQFPILKENNALCQKPTDPESETAATFSKCNE